MMTQITSVYLREQVEGSIKNSLLRARENHISSLIYFLMFMTFFLMMGVGWHFTDISFPADPKTNIVLVINVSVSWCACENFTSTSFFSVQFQFTKWFSDSSIFFLCPLCVCKVGYFLPSFLIVRLKFPTLCLAWIIVALHTFIWNLFETRKKGSKYKDSGILSSWLRKVSKFIAVMWCNVIWCNLIQMHPTVYGNGIYASDRWIIIFYFFFSLLLIRHINGRLRFFFDGKIERDNREACD